MVAPATTFGATAAALASAAHGAAAARSFDIDIASGFTAKFMVKITNGGSVSTTRGVQIDVYEQYENATPAFSTTNPQHTIAIGQAVAASGVYFSPKISLDTGKYHVVITNLDASQGITTEATLDRVLTVA
jgi:hypothetical protein